MKTSSIILLIIAVVIIGWVVWPKSKPVVQAPADTTTQDDSILGCYEATIARDVYTLEIDSQNDGEVMGKLAYKNFEKDSSSGTLVGVYDNGMLVGDYSFSSEGMDSVAEVAFKKTDQGFVRGFGDTHTEGNREVITDTSKLSYDNSPTFIKTDCKS